MTPAIASIPNWIPTGKCGQALLWSTVLGICTRCVTKSLLPQAVSLPGSASSFPSLRGICLTPGGGGRFPPVSSRQFADLPVLFPRTLCQRALNHFPRKEGDVSASALPAEAALWHMGKVFSSLLFFTFILVGTLITHAKDLPFGANA